MDIIKKTIDDYKNQSLDRLVQQFKGKRSLESILFTFSEEIGLLESAFYDLYKKRLPKSDFKEGFSDFSVVSGQQLDLLGTILGQDREGASDEDYRILLSSIIGIHNSFGTAPSLINFATSITGVSLVNAVEIKEENYPASFEMIIHEPITFSGDRLFASLSSAKPAGVSFQMQYHTSANVFTFDDRDPNNYSSSYAKNGIGASNENISTTLGFADELSPGTGGGLAGIITT